MFVVHVIMPCRFLRSYFFPCRTISVRAVPEIYSGDPHEMGIYLDSDKLGSYNKAVLMLRWRLKKRMAKQVGSIRKRIV